MSNTILFLIALNFFGCGFNSKNETLDESKLKEPLINANKSRVELESEQIKAFIARRNWQMTTTETGLRYMITQNGIGEIAKEKMFAKVNFEVTLLDGTLCYSTKESGPQEFLIGMDNVESGLHEGITYLHKGDKAVLILPSHLAHGLIGDRNKIPAKSTIIYTIELLDLHN